MTDADYRHTSNCITELSTSARNDAEAGSPTECEMDINGRVYKQVLKLLETQADGNDFILRRTGSNSAYLLTIVYQLHNVF